MQKEQMRRREKAAATSATADTISRLPNEILCRILSFLTTKEAVATTILSKRWTHLWIFVPDINFTNIRVHSIKSNNKFNEFVNSVLTSHDAAGYNVDSFHLDIRYGDTDLAYEYGFSNIIIWINLVVKHKLKYFRLNHDLDVQNVYETVYLPNLSISIFTCKTLVSLKLRRFRVEGFSFSNIEFEFPLLKILHLDNIDFAEDRDYVLFLSGCPILEELEILNVFLTFEVNSLALQEFKSLTLPKLIRADISECFWCYYPLKALSTSKSLCLDRLKLSTEDHRDNDKVNQLQHFYDDIPVRKLRKISPYYQICGRAK